MPPSQQTTLADTYVRQVLSNTSKKRNLDLAALSPKDFLSQGAAGRDVAWLGHAIHRARGYTLDTQVVNADGKLINQTWANPAKLAKFTESIGKHPQLITPPLPLMWIEYDTILSSGGQSKSGFLLEALPNNQPGIRITPVSWAERFGIIPNSHHNHLSFALLKDPDGSQKQPILTLYGTDGFMHEGGVVKSRHENVAEGINSKLMDLIAASQSFATSAVMILKSRLPVLQLIEPDAATALPAKFAKRLQQGRTPGKIMGRLTFDITRTMSKGRASNEDEARRFVAEQVVMGHFKLREVRARDAAGNLMSGKELQLLWWNPHWRGGTEAEKLARQDQPPVMAGEREAIARRPADGLIIPGIHFIPDRKHG